MSSTLTVLDVGHGSCAIVQSSEEVVLIDTGPGASVLEYLLQQQISHIDVVVVSHADSDHIRGLIALLGTEEFTIGHIFLNSDAEKGSELWVSLVFELDDQRRRGRLELTPHLRQGDVIGTSTPELELEILAPRDALALLGPGARDDRGRRITTNTISAVLRLRVAGWNVALLTGDLDELGLDHILETTGDLKADVLVFPHHGGLSGQSAGTAREFAERLGRAVEPVEVAISLGRARFNNPRPEIVQGMRDARPCVRIACTQLSKRCAPNLPAVSADHLLELHSAGRSSGACCAGTMRVELAEHSVRLAPGAASHDAFITAAAGELAICRRTPIEMGLPRVRN